VRESEKLSLLHEILGPHYRVGSEYLFACPFCTDHNFKKKFSINLSKNAAKCWVCGKAFRNVEILVRQHGTREQYSRWTEGKEQINSIGRGEGEIVDLLVGKQEEKINKIIQLPERFQTLCNDEHPSAGRQYLMGRGLSQRDVLLWKIGFAGNRVIVPSFDKGGCLNYYVGRSVDDKTWPPYINPDVSKQDIIFNELYIDWTKPVILTEGVFDAIRIDSALSDNSENRRFTEHHNVIPILGSILNKNFKLYRKVVQNRVQVILALDQDAAGKQEKITELLWRQGINVKHLDTTGYKDPGVMPKDVIARRINGLTSPTTEDFMRKRLGEII